VLKTQRVAQILPILVVLIGVVLSSGPVGAQTCPQPEAISLQTPNASYDIGRQAKILYDPTGNLSYAQILSAQTAGKFASHCTGDFSPPQGSSVLWVRFDVARITGATDVWVVVFRNPEIDEVRFYRPSAGGLFALQRTGRAVPSSARDIVSRLPAVSLNLESEEPSAVYMRISGVSSAFLSIELVSAKEFADREGIDLLTLAAILGFMIAMLAYNLIIYFRSRLHQCLYYFLYLGGMIVNVAIYDGLVYRFADLPLSGQFADNLAQAFLIAASISLLLFGRSLLRLPETAPRMNLITLWAGGTMAVVMVLELVGVLPSWTASTIIAMSAGAAMCGFAIFFAVKGYRPAVYFSLSFLALMVGAALEAVAFYLPAVSGGSRALAVFIGVQQNWSFHIGICAEAVLISFAITYFIRDMQAEVVEARAEADQTRVETVAARQEFSDKYTDLAKRVGILSDDGDGAGDDAPSQDTEFYDNAVRVIQAKMADETFDIATLADALAVSERTLRRRVREAADMSPVELLRRERLAQGRRHLENRTYQTVAEVALAVGIASPGYFARHYKGMFGHSPREALKNS
jgi:AraC-like DNA-binding protein